MKSSFILPVFFLLVFIAVFISVTGMVLVIEWVRSANPAFESRTGWFAGKLPETAFSCMVLSLLLSLIAVFAKMRKNPGVRALTICLVSATSFLIIIGGFTLMYGPGGGRRAALPGFSPFAPRTIHNISDEALYIDGVVEGDQSGSFDLHAVIRRTEAGLTYYPTGVVHTDNGLPVYIVDPQSPPVVVSPENPASSPLYELPPFLQAAVKDAKALNIYLHNLRSASSAEFLFAAFSLSLVAMGCGLFIRTAQWPLIGGFMTLAAFRGVFLLIRFFESDIGMEISGTIFNKDFSEQLPTFVLFVIGILLIAADLLFVKNPIVRGRQTGG